MQATVAETLSTVFQIQARNEKFVFISLFLRVYCNIEIQPIRI